MKNKKTLSIWKTFIVSICLTFALESYAGHIPISGSLASSAITAVPTASFSVTDNLFSNLPNTIPSGFLNTKVNNTILLYVDHSYPNYSGTAYKYTVKVEIKKTSSALAVSTQNVFLTLEYDPAATPGNSYRDRVAYSFTGAHKMELKILEIKDASGTLVTNPADNFILEGSLDIERYYNLNTSSTACVTATDSDLNADGVKDEITLNWNTISGAETYDLEWTWVDDYSTNLTTPIAASAIQWNFKNNATRVSTTVTSYKLNLVYERGYLIFRVRAVGRLFSNPVYDVFADWSRSDVGTNPTSGACSSSYYYVIDAHRGELNWQYSSVFAEEGKKKEITSYYDGSLRGRQTVTKINSDNTAVAGESIYDYNGRKAIDILPVPLQSPALDYNANLNVNTSGNKYSWADFDVDQTSCNASTAALGSTSGSGQYYSSSNTNLSGNNAYIPDAGGFPFSQVEYTPDNTGRIRRQGGVGQYHQLGSGHETKYYYGQPNQIELDRLFGSEVGYARHYKKNMVVDPNGQVSISYLDQEGRVIATALSGSNPTNVSSLESKPNAPTTVTADMFASDINGKSYLNIPNIEYTALEYNAYLLVSEPGIHVFNYGMTPMTYSPECASSICFDCIYDLEIAIRDECGAMLPGLPKKIRIGHPELNTNCSNEIYFSEYLGSLSFNLGIGNYHVTKTLSVNKEAYEYYLQEYLNPESNSCIVPFATILEEEKAKLDYDGCEITCEECAEALGTKDEYVLAGKGTEDEWTNENNRCKEPCKGADLCEATFDIMLGDMAPGGQYGEYLNTITGINEPTLYPLSIYNEINLLPDGGLPISNLNAAYWRNPQMEIFGSSGSSLIAGYYEADGITRSKIRITELPNGTVTPESDSSFVLDGVTYCFPEDLSNLNDFISYWRSSWAWSLVYYHPEYCYNKWCNANLNKAFTEYGKTSSEFDDMILNLNTWSEAITLFPSILSTNTLVNADPYFNSPNGSSQKTTMQNKVDNWEGTISMLQVAAITVNCPSYYGFPLPTPLPPQPLCDDFGSPLSTTEQLNKQWITYRSLYLSYKQDLMAASADEWVMNSENCNRGINHCIGDADVDYNPFESNIDYSDFNSDFYQPCSHNTFKYYSNKVKRFDLRAQAAKSQIDEDKAQYNRAFDSKACPLDLDFTQWLNEMADKGTIKTNHKVYEDIWFTPTIHKAVIAPSAPSATFGDWSWNPTMLSNIMDIHFTSPSLGTATCNVVLELPSGYNWSSTSIVEFNNFQYKGYNAIPPSYTFELDAVLNTGNNIKIKGKSCLPFGNCNFNDDCKNTDFANDLALLMSAIAKNNDLVNTGVNLETGYPNSNSRFIRNNVGSTPNNNLRWSYIGSGIFKIHQNGTVPSSSDIDIQFNSYSPSSFNSTMLSQIEYFTNFKYVNTNLIGDFTVSGWYSATGLPPYTEVEISGSVSRGRLGNCTDPVPVLCDNIQYDVTTDFEALLSQYIPAHPTADIDLMTDNSYTSLLESYIGKGNATLKNPIWGDNEINTSIELTDPTTNAVLSNCAIRLYRKNLKNFTSNGSISNISEIGMIGSDGQGYLAGAEHNFTLMVKFTNGINEEIYGSVSCIPIGTCPECDPPIVLSLGGDCPNYNWYLQEVQNFNMSGGPGVPIIPNDNNFPCECVSNYLYYLRAFRLGNAYNLFKMVGCDTPLSVTPIDLNQYSTVYGCKMTFCNECDLWGTVDSALNSGTAQQKVLMDAVTAFNNKFSTMGTPPAWFTPVIMTEDSIGALECECAVKYGVYLNRWVNALNTEHPHIDYPDFQPVTYSRFKAQGCDADCWWQYHYYVQKSQVAGATNIASFSKKIGCDCWLRFTDHYGNLAGHSPKDVNTFCSAPILMYPNPYSDFNPSIPISTRKKNNAAMQSLKRDFNKCEYEPLPTVIYENPCSDYLDKVAYRNAEIRYQNMIADLTTQFQNEYYTHCMSAIETMTVQYPTRDYHFTLYYYDQAGSLVRTVPPAGVKFVTDPDDFELINADRTNGTHNFYTSHILNTVYEYNSLNQLLKQSVPDHDKMNLWYISATTGIPTGFDAKDVQFINGNNGIMVGNLNGVSQFYRTVDGGEHWFREGDIYTGDINKIAMVNTSLGYAVANGGILLKTSDGGQNWVIVALNNYSIVDFNDVVVRNNGGIYEGYVGGKSGFFEYFSDNSGTITWSGNKLPVSLAGAETKSISFKETATGTGYAVVEFGGLSRIIKCTSWTGLWTELTLDDKLRTTDIACNWMIDNSNGFAAGADGLLLKTSDGGANWSIVETGVSFNFKDIFFSTLLKGLAINSSGVIYKTSDGGLTWTQASAIGIYNGFHFWDKTTGKGFAVGENGLIAKIDISGTNFKIQKLNPAQVVSADFNNVYFRNADDGVIVGDNGVVYLVSNASGNLLWYSITGAPTADITNIYSYSATIGTVTIGGNVYRMNISGTAPTFSGTFTQLTSGTNNYTQFSEYASSLCVLNASSSPHIATFTASNPTTATINSISTLAGDGELKDIVSLSSTNHIVVGNLGTIRKYSGTWNSTLLNTKPNTLNKIKSLAGSTELWIAGNDGNLFKSTNDGSTFSMVQTGVVSDLLSLDISSTGEGFAAGAESTVLYLNSSTVSLVNCGTTATVKDVISSGTGVGYIITSDKFRPVLYTSNGGLSFTGIYPGGLLMPGTTYTTAFRNTNNDILIGGTSGTLARMDGSSSVWSRSFLGTEELRDLDLSKGIGVSVGIKGITLRTVDDGNSWYYNPQIPISGTGFADFNKVHVTSKNLVYAVGSHHSTLGILAKTMHLDGSSVSNIMFNIAPASTTDFNGLSFNEFGYGILAGGSVVYKQTPGSTSWAQVLSTPGIVYKGAAVQGKYAIVTGNSGTINRSDNFMSGTSTFTSVTPPSGTASSDFNNVVMYDRSRAYIIGTNGVLLKTVDNALTWTQKDAGTGSSAVNLNTLALNKRDHLVFAGTSGYSKLVTDQADFASAIFWYDRLGRMVVSQNTRQFNKGTQAYSYTLYDEFGRITEVGEKASSDRIENTLSGRQIDDALLSAWIIAGGSSTRTEITQTYYDEQRGPAGVITQNNTKKRVVAVYYMDVHTSLTAGATSGFGHATYYSYDVHGNVDHLVQDIPDLAAISNQYKHLHYNYDLISGKVNQVDYNPGQEDEYHHRYSYDADNRIVQVETSRDGFIWDKDANYEYYKHGPLARTELGDLKVQGLDYSYTIQGWIKGVNSNTLDATRDPGRDGDLSLSGNTHTKVGKDAFGYTLGYFQGDYVAIKSFTTAEKFEAQTSGSDLMSARNDLWNGNIGSMVTCLPKASDYSASQTITAEAYGSAYKYDQLNRLASSRVFTNINTTTNEWQSGGGTNPAAYATDYTYDAMGNILTQKRNGGGASPVALDELTYNYHTTTDGLVSNRLYHVDDAVTSTNYTDDIDDQGTFNNTHTTIETANNYGYDELGNLVRDVQEDIAAIEWTVYGKIKKVTRTGSSTKADLEFGYDAGGNRLWKKVTPKGAGAVVKTFYYLRDAQGNEMCRYVKYINTASQTMYVSEEHSIYGSSRVGVDNRKDTLYMGTTYTPTWGGMGTNTRELGEKSFELSNHLGNVLVTVSDKLVYKTSSGTIYFEAEITSITDYYPFGSCMQGRAFSGGSYRFGFNNQEKDGELGDAYAFEYRIHDARLGRFLSVDPLKMEYPWNSTYAFAENRVIDGIDLEGAEWKKVTDNAGKATGFTWDPTNAYDANGGLKDGYYKTAIYFFEKTTVPVSGDANKASGFHATAKVYKTDGTTKDYEATTLPSDNEKFGTVEEGFYEAKPGKHTGYAALHVMNDASKSEDWNNRSLPAVNGNNPSNGSKVVVGVNIHKAGKNDYLGTYTKADGSIGGVSEGCFTIKRGKDDVLWNDFMSNFTSNDAIGILLTRNPLPSPQIKPSTPSTPPTNTPSSSNPTSTSNSNWYDDVVDFFSDTWDTLVNGIVQTEKGLEAGNAP